MVNKTFIEIWKSLPPSEKDNTAVTLASECNAALATVQSWGLGYRTPKARSQEIIVKHFASKGVTTTAKTLFPC